MPETFIVSYSQTGSQCLHDRLARSGRPLPGRPDQPGLVGNLRQAGHSPGPHHFCSGDIAACPNLCTPSPPGKRSRPRSLVVRGQPEHEALQARRVEQKSEIWKKRYSCRAGIEGTLSQGIRGFGLRRCRYVGHAKTHLQHLFTAAAINLARLDAWLQGSLRAQTRQSKLTALVPNAA